jgi:hypothetical protein
MCHPFYYRSPHHRETYLRKSFIGGVYIGVKKAQEKKLRTQIEKSVGKNIVETDSLLIDDVIDWIKISIKAKENYRR